MALNADGKEEALRKLAVGESPAASASCHVVLCPPMIGRQDPARTASIGAIVKKSSLMLVSDCSPLQVVEQDDEHLYHTTGWARELWIHSLGMKAVLPPPGEEKDVKTATGAARAKQARGGMKKASQERVRSRITAARRRRRRRVRPVVR